jgi:alkylation response protein AidB-like acyl-CoA dehydrogenase
MVVGTCEHLLGDDDGRSGLVPDLAENEVVARAGWCGLNWPQAYGGAGGTLVEQTGPASVASAIASAFRTAACFSDVRRSSL